MKAVKRAARWRTAGSCMCTNGRPPAGLCPTETLHPNSHTNPTPQTTYATLLPYTPILLCILQPTLPYYYTEE